MHYGTGSQGASYRVTEYLPAQRPRHRSVRINELWWDGDDSSLILWLHQVHDEGIVFDGAR